MGALATYSAAKQPATPVVSKNIEHLTPGLLAVGADREGPYRKSRGYAENMCSMD